MIHAYGPDPDQWVELFPPHGDPLGVAVIIHGGFWRAAYDASLGRPLAIDLAQRGWFAYNVEYRRVGRGGGWPTTLQDIADAIDLLAQFNLDLTRVVGIGHSAGGQLATWAAGRSDLPTSAPGARPRVSLSGVISQAGVLDLNTGAAKSVGGTAILDFLGGGPFDVPQRYQWADPRARVPLPVPVVCVHSRCDDSVPFEQSETYVATAREAGGVVRLVEVEGDHMAHVDVRTPAWTAVLDELSQFASA